MVFSSISEKLRLMLVRRAFPIPVELLLTGSCTRPWLLDHGTMIPRQVDYPDIAEKIEAWCSEHCKLRNKIQWRDFSIEELSEGIGESVSTTRNWFQLVCGKDLRVWKMEHRIDIAKRLIEEGGLSISEVAARAGFNDRANFSRQFRRTAGCSPSDWKA
ncbi:MAG: AraC family transcriptional regulator [Bacteroidales bacterium]|nr:AraC family transcriptional regulator [Bacteroidales bacterium]